MASIDVSLHLYEHCRWQMQVVALESQKKDDVIPVLDTGIQEN
ncbi:hypothetical protein [Wolbachia endosymbiont (group A) of Anomoia purmunda]|nr:hypothetical protein [Wolbachia endosymbiont (group A) of Anomoia purmunda]